MKGYKVNVTECYIFYQYKQEDKGNYKKWGKVSYRKKHLCDRNGIENFIQVK